MWRKRSTKHRYWNVLRRLRLIPGIAALALAGCGSRAMPSSSAPAIAVNVNPSANSAEPKELLNHQFDRQWWPTELLLAPELRSACRPWVELPPHLELADEARPAPQLEPLVTCLTFGWTKTPRLHLAGETELPGVLPSPTKGNGRADTLRSTLATLGVPFESIETHRVDSGRFVEVGIEPS